jgi:hypothetical protein
VIIRYPAGRGHNSHSHSTRTAVEEGVVDQTPPTDRSLYVE